MAIDPSANNAAAVFGLAFAIRFVLFQFPAAPSLLGDRVEISTPITSFKRLSEGVFLFANGVPPYDGGVVHQAPLLLGLFYPIISAPLLVNILYMLSDLAIGYMLLQITTIKDRDNAKEKKIMQYGGKKEEPGMSGLAVATLYLFNPYTIVNCIGRSTILFSNAAVVAAIWMGMKGNKSLAMFSVATATYISLYPAMLIIPILLMLTRKTYDSQLIKKIAAQCTGLFVGSLASLFVLSFVLVNSWDFFGSVYGTILTVSDLTPNLGLCWYFFIEMFDQFRPFFLVVFQLHLFIFAVPVSIKLRNYPLFVSFLLCAIMGTFKGYPSVGDASLYLGLLPLSSEIFKYMRYSFLEANLFMYSSLLAPIFWYLWIYVGSGNANFFYAIGLVYGVGEIILMIDTTYALLRRDFEARSPPVLTGEDPTLGWDREAMAPFDDALERMERLLRCSLWYTSNFSHALLPLQQLPFYIVELVMVKIHERALKQSVYTKYLEQIVFVLLVVSQLGDTKGVLPSQQTEVLSEDSNNLPPQATQQQVPPTISQLQRLLNIRKTTSPTPLPRQESESPPDRSPYYGSQELSTGGASHFNTPQMPTPSFPISLLDLGSQKNSDIDQTQSSCKPSVSIDSSRKRRLQPEECSEQQKAIHDSNGDVNSTKKNKKPLRAFQRHDLYSPDDMIRIRRHQPMNNKKNNKSEMSANDDKRIWSCMFCDKTMNIGRDVHIEECPTCGRSQVKLEVKQEAEEGLPVLNTDSDDDDRQVIQSSQPTLDANMYTLMPYRDQLYPSIDNDSSHSKQLLPSSPPDNSVINHDSSFNIISKSTSNSFKSPVTSRSESHSGHAISCVFTGLSKDQKDAFDDNITRVIEAGLFMEHIPDQVFNESATHIITSIDSSIWKRFGVALCPRVLKYLVAMLSDGWIVRHEWFLDSIKARMWLPLPDVKYLIQGDAQFGPAPGTQYRRELRIQQSYKLFDSCKMFFYGEFGTAAQKSIKKQELLRLVQCGGASVLMKRPPKSSAIRTRSRTPSKHENIQPGSNNHNNNNGADENLFSSTRTFLYLTEEYKPWQVPIDKTAPIIVCDPTKIPSGLISHGSPSSKNGSPSSPSTTTASTTTTLTSVDLKKHGWLRDFQAVSLTWVLNCISCSLMGKADIEMLYGSSNPKEIQELDQAWDSWRANKS
ncbi:hypothetical protein FBU30_006171 [Linnemannia zychae]|nr:hypothetical protein FBU30_006171 [Linnemannia zychae]